MYCATAPKQLILMMRELWSPTSRTLLHVTPSSLPICSHFVSFPCSYFPSVLRDYSFTHLSLSLYSLLILSDYSHPESALLGMATNIPPHNLGELCDAVVALVDDPHLSDEALFKIIPAPDFPTGGQIMGLSGAEELYKTGTSLPSPLR